MVGVQPATDIGRGRGHMPKGLVRERVALVCTRPKFWGHTESESANEEGRNVRRIIGDLATQHGIGVPWK